jgi:hypothetical protein
MLEFLLNTPASGTWCGLQTGSQIVRTKEAIWNSTPNGGERFLSHSYQSGGHNCLSVSMCLRCSRHITTPTFLSQKRNSQFPSMAEYWLSVSWFSTVPNSTCCERSGLQKRTSLSCSFIFVLLRILLFIFLETAGNGGSYCGSKIRFVFNTQQNRDSISRLLVPILHWKSFGILLVIANILPSHSSVFTNLCPKNLKNSVCS